MSDPQIGQLRERMERYDNWVRLRVFHRRLGAPPALVATRERSAVKASEQSVGAEVDSLVRELQQHAGAFVGEQHYQCSLLADEADEQVLCELVLVLHGKVDPLLAQQEASALALPMHGGAALAPAGETAEIMRMLARHAEGSFRHTERAWNIIGNAYRGVLGAIGTENQRLSSRCQELEARQLHAAELTESARSQEHERQMASGAAAHRAAMQQQIFARIGEIAPYAISALSGAPAVKKLVDTLSEEQLKALMMMSTPEQQELLIDMVQKGERGEEALQVLAGLRPPPAPSDTQPYGTPLPSEAPQPPASAAPLDRQESEPPPAANDTTVAGLSPPADGHTQRSERTTYRPGGRQP